MMELKTNYRKNTMAYQPIRVLEDVFEPINETASFNNKIQVNNFGSDHFIIQNDHSDYNKNDNQTQQNDEDTSEDENNDELDSSHQLNFIKFNKIIN